MFTKQRANFPLKTRQRIQDCVHHSHSTSDFLKEIMRLSVWFIVLAVTMLMPFSEWGGGGGSNMMVMARTARQQPTQITSFTLVNANNNQDIITSATLNRIDLAQFPENIGLDLRANTQGVVGSVLFVIALKVYTIPAVYFNLYSTISNQAPFTLGGGSNSANNSTSPYVPISILTTPGFYTVNATVYKAPNLQGGIAATAGIQFEILPKNGITNFTLIDVKTSTKYPMTVDKDFIYYIPRANTDWTIQANTVGAISRVEFVLAKDLTLYDPIFKKVDKVAPFTADGRSTNAHYIKIPTLSNYGNYALTATAYIGPINTQPTVLIRVRNNFYTEFPTPAP